jgi:hypothetical protein
VRYLKIAPNEDPPQSVLWAETWAKVFENKCLVQISARQSITYNGGRCRD